VLLHDQIGGIPDQFGQKRPARRLRFEIVALAATMLDEDDNANLFSHPRGEPVDAVDDAGQIVFGCPVEQPDLHIDDQHDVHRGGSVASSMIRKKPAPHLMRGGYRCA